MRSQEPGLVVLIYHRVGGGTPSEVDLPVGLFDEQMAELAAAERVVSLDAGLGGLAGGAGERSGSESHDVTGRVVVSFDDGTADFVDHVVPHLDKHQVPAVLYLATEFVERQVRYADGAVPVSWQGLSDAISTGLVTVGSHTHTHRLLDRVDAQIAADELDRSIGLIEDNLGVDVRHFAYPKALQGSPAAEEQVRARFVSAAVAGTHANVPGRTDPHRLARSPIQTSDEMRWFRAKADGGMGLEDRLRGVLNRVRYRGLAT